MDPRWEELAKILIHYSTATQPGDRVLISMIETEMLPLARAVYAEAVRAGAFPHVEFMSAYLDRDLLQFGSEEQISQVPEMQARGIEWADVYLSLRGSRNPHELSAIPPERFVLYRQAMGHISALRTAHTRWVVVRAPGEAFAQQAEMSLEDALDLFFNATLCDWAAETRRYAELQRVFQAAQTVRIVGRGTDLAFSTRGRTYCIGNGHINMPDGEIFTAPVEDSVEGTITFDFPGVFFGQKVEGIRLELAGGRVVQASASRNEALLHRLLAMDGGSDRFGEFGVGTNNNIQRFCYDLFYDEKIGGTVHFALGRSYAECGGVNQSALHWDIVKDLRDEGAIYLDGELVFQNGRYLV